MDIHDPITALLGTWSAELNLWSILFRVALCVVLSAIIGCERSSKRHSAGLRTFILVSLASTVAALVDVYLLQTAGASFAAISAATVVGAAMISGNSILFSSKSQIKGLTTAAALWACGAIGLSVGAGLYSLSLISYAALLCSLSLFPWIETYLKDKSNHFEIHLVLNSRSNLLD